MGWSILSLLGLSNLAFLHKMIIIWLIIGHVGGHEERKMGKKWAGVIKMSEMISGTSLPLVKLFVKSTKKQREREEKERAQFSLSNLSLKNLGT